MKYHKGDKRFIRNLISINMLISKFDLYKSEWLELVFDNRNKAYGAYELRQHYSNNMIKAMCIAFLSIGVSAFIIGVIIKPVVTQIAHDMPQTAVVVLSRVNIAKPPVTPPAAAHHARVILLPAPSAPVNTVRNPPMVVTPDPVAVEPPTKTQLATSAIGPVDIKSTIKGTEGGSSGPGVGPGTPAAPGNGEAVGTAGLERMPEPFGGAAAWQKFLQKNLVYPDMAVDQGREGRVWLSFIVERDGHLSDIKVERGAGFGMDEEAIRVLKLAPAWKPGIQNGQPVRVKYNIPINFQLSD